MQKNFEVDTVDSGGDHSGNQERGVTVMARFDSYQVSLLVMGFLMITGSSVPSSAGETLVEGVPYVVQRAHLD